MKRYATIAAACAIALSATAQNLSKEITVEKDYVPVERKAVKQNALPDVQKNSVDMNAKLDYSDWAVPAPVPAKIPTMLPYGYLTSKDFDQKRGYLRLGAGSQLNITGSAGYRIVDDTNNTLAMWVQHNSTWAGKNSSRIYAEPLDVFTQKYNNNTIGVDFTSQFYEGTLNIGARVNFDNFNYYGLVDQDLGQSTRYNYIPDEFNNQTFSQFGFTAGWKNRESGNKFNYNVQLGVGHGGFKKTPFDEFKGLKETSFNIAFGGCYNIKEHLNAGADVKFDYASYNDAPTINLDTWKQGGVNEDNSLGIARIAPFVTFHRPGVMLRLGFNADIAINAGTTFRIAPNVKLDYAVASGVGLFIDLNGGKSINHLWQMKAINRYVNPSVRYGTTYMPLDLEAGLKLGSFGGFSAKLFGGFASYKDVQLPFFATAPNMPSATGYDILLPDLTSTTFYRPVEISGWKAGAELAYRYRSVVDANVRFTYSPQNQDEGCVLSIDRPEYVINANINIKPIDKLTVSLGYEMRGNRAVWGYQQVENRDYWECHELDNAMNLKVGASYQLLNNLTLFVEGNNLMNKQWDVLYGQGAQKLNVMGGATLTF